MPAMSVRVRYVLLIDKQTYLPHDGYTQGSPQDKLKA